MRWKTLLISISAATPLFIIEWSSLSQLPRDKSWAFFFSYPTLSFYALLWLSILAIGAGIYGLLRVSHGFLAQLLLAAYAFITLNGLRHYFLTGINLMLPPIPRVAAGLMGIAVLALIYRNRSIVPWAFRKAFTILFPFSLYCLFLTILALHRGNFVRYPPPHEDLPQVKRPRIMVLIFDEWDFRRSFETYSKDLPEMQRLRHSWFSGENVVAVSNRTRLSIPSYLVGKPIQMVKAKEDLLLLDPTENRYRPILEFDTLFSIAERAGRGTGILGYHLPYCRMFLAQARRCRTFRHEGFLDFPIDASQFFSNLVDRLLPYRARRFYSRAHANYEESLKFFFDLLDDPSIDFIFSHWSFPHLPHIPPGPMQKGSYRHNLVYLDSALTRIRKRIGDDSIVFLTSDHWFRSLPAENDYRIPLLIRLPSQAKGEKYTKMVNSVHIYDLVVEALNDRLRSFEDVRRILHSHASEKVKPIFVDKEEGS